MHHLETTFFAVGHERKKNNYWSYWEEKMCRSWQLLQSIKTIISSFFRTMYFWFDQIVVSCGAPSSFLINPAWSFLLLRLFVYLPHSCICVVWEVRGQILQINRPDTVMLLIHCIPQSANWTRGYTSTQIINKQRGGSWKLPMKYNTKQMCLYLEKSLYYVVKMNSYHY